MFWHMCLWTGACGYAMCLLLPLLLLLEGHVLLVRRPGADFKAAGGAVVRHTHQPLHLSPVEAVALEGTHPPAVAKYALAVCLKSELHFMHLNFVVSPVPLPSFLLYSVVSSSSKYV